MDADTNLPQDCIIFDIDGTLADPVNRRPFLRQTPKDYDSFHANMDKDPPYRDVCLLAELLGDHPLVNQGAIKLFICTGRMEKNREETEFWLSRHVLSYYKAAEKIMMRPNGDFRKDHIIKREMLQEIRNMGYEPRIVIDDRPSVVQMWKDEGVTVLAHDSGEW